MSGHIYNTYVTKHPKFEDRISGLNGHEHDCGISSQVDQYTGMSKSIALYVTTFKNGYVVRQAIEELCIPTIKLPDYLATNATAAAKIGIESA